MDNALFAENTVTIEGLRADVDEIILRRWRYEN